MTQRAPFIVIEGLDRSGKTTQTGKLYETLKDIGVEAKLIKFPGEPEYLPFRAIITPHVSHSNCMIFSFSDLIYIDRTTPIGQMIDAYLRSTSELDDHSIHLLFSANRWELA